VPRSCVLSENPTTVSVLSFCLSSPGGSSPDWPWCWCWWHPVLVWCHHPVLVSLRQQGQGVRNVRLREHEHFLMRVRCGILDIPNMVSICSSGNSSSGRSSSDLSLDAIWATSFTRSLRILLSNWWSYVLMASNLHRATVLSQAHSSYLGYLLPRTFQAFDVSSHTQLCIYFIPREVIVMRMRQQVKLMISSVPHKVATKL